MQETVYAYAATMTRDDAGRFLIRFPDLPEALTDGATEEEALHEAKDCLSEALMGRIADGEPIPVPSRPRRGQYQVAPEPTVALKVALHSLVRVQQISTAELARRLKVDHKEARRLLDPRHSTKLPRLTEALDALGHEVVVTVHDASRRGRLLTTRAPDRRPMAVRKAIKVKQRA